MILVLLIDALRCPGRMAKSASTRPRNERLRVLPLMLWWRDRVAAVDCVQILDGVRAVVVGVTDDLLDVTMPAVLSLALLRAGGRTGHDAFSRSDSAWERLSER
ncbi:hypothetical protein ACOTFG_04875 [Achromobacter xylosoxidans]